MKINFLLTQDLSSPSGGGRYWPLARGLALLGHTVKIIALHSDYHNLPTKTSYQDGVLIDYVGQMHVRKVQSRKFYFSSWGLIWVAIKATFAMGIAAIQSSSDITHIGKPHPMNSIAGLLARLTGASKYLLLDCDDYEAVSNKSTHNWQKSILQWFEDTMPFKVSATSTNTHFMEERLHRMGVKHESVFYLPNGVDQDRFSISHRSRVDGLQKSLNIGDCPVILYIGSLSKTSHPIDILINAFARIAQVDSKTILLIVGGGEDLESLQQLVVSLNIKDRVIFTGKVPAEEVPYYYQLATVTVDPVNDDDIARGRCPLKLFESWASGIPIVTSAVGDRSELIGDPPASLAVEPGNPIALAEGLSTLIDKPDLQNTLKERGKALVKDYDWCSLSADLESLYLTILNK